MAEKNLIHIQVGRNRSKVELICLSAGDDYIVYLYGGKAHIGAAGVGYFYGGSAKKANSSVIALSGHREDDLVKDISRILARELKSTVAVIAGIHFDALKKDERLEIIANAKELTRLLVEHIHNS